MQKASKCGCSLLLLWGSRVSLSIFHWKWASRWLPSANEIYTQKKKCTWPTPEFCVGTQRNLYSNGLRLGFASGKTQILGLASGVFAFLDTNMLVSPRGKCGVGGVSPARTRREWFGVAVEYRLNRLCMCTVTMAFTG